MKARKKPKPTVTIQLTKSYKFGEHVFGTWGKTELMYELPTHLKGRKIADDGDYIRTVERCNNLLWLCWNKNSAAPSCTVQTTVKKLKKLAAIAEKSEKSFRAADKKAGRPRRTAFFKHFGNLSFFFTDDLPKKRSKK